MGTYMINRTPTATLNWKSPCEVLYDKEPRYDNIKTFGCLCYASNIYPKRNKLDPRAIKCVFLVYSTAKKTYKIYDLNNQKALISRDVILHERVSPYRIDNYDDNHVPFPIFTDEIDEENWYNDIEGNDEDPSNDDDGT